MSFLLYRIDDAGRQYHREKELVGELSLWGKKGSVARCVGSRGVKTGGWSVTAKDMLAELVPRKFGKDANPEHFAILDDLVPNGPERIVGRIDKIKGYLDNGHDPDNAYNPIIIIMTEVIHVQPPNDPIAQKSFKAPPLEPLDVPGGNARIIRTINYLWNNWQPPRSFAGALLWPEHWEYLRQF